MKVRIGVGAPVADADTIGPLLDSVGNAGFDSIWFAEVLTRRSFDPIVALTWAAARYPTMKLGTTMLLPGRNVVRLAKQLASLDQLSAGRLLVTFVPGLAQHPESGAIGVPQPQRRQAIETTLPLLRRLLAGASVSYDGDFGSFTEVQVAPLPVQQPLEFWLGGIAPRSLELCGRLGEGWLPSLCTPEQAVAGRQVIEASAAAAGRQISPEHYGVSIGYASRPLDAAARARVLARAKTGDIDALVPVGHDALRALLKQFVVCGFSKFVVRPTDAPADWPRELNALADAVLDLQT